MESRVLIEIPTEEMEEEQMELRTVFETIDELNGQYTDVWADICRIESPTSDKAGVDAVVGYVAAHARARGWRVDIEPQEVSGDVLTVTVNADSGEAPLTLSAHLDTVHPVGSFGEDPVRIEGERIYGPGVTDCKGGAVAALLAMDALMRCEYEKRPVRLILQTDEEKGSLPSGRATIRHICESSKGSVAFLNLEGQQKGTACIARKGILNLIFHVRGIAAHSSACATEGANAILEAAHKIIEMEKLKDDAGLTCNCGVVCGGTVSNTVAEDCTVCANVRFADGEQLAYVREYARRVAEEVHVPGCSCELIEERLRIAMEDVEQNHVLLDRLNALFEESGMPVLQGMKRNGGSDAAEVTDYGIPCLDSLGVQGGKIHSTEEYALLSSLAEAAKRIAVAAYGL